METDNKKKKLLIFVPQIPVLTETFIQREITWLVKSGKLDIEVVALKPGDASIEVPFSEKIHYQRLGLLDFVPTVFYVLTNLNRLNKLYSILNPSHLAFIPKLFLVFKAFGYARIFSYYKPDFILVHFMSTPSTIVMLASEILNIPFGISAHARDVMVDGEFIFDKVKRAKFILICNKNAFNYIKKVMKDNAIDNVYLHYHGIDFKELNEKGGSLETQLEKPLAFNIGRLTEKKGHEYLIEASKILKERHISHLIYIAGPGPLYDDLMKKIESLDVSDTVKILGNGKGISFDEIVKYYKAASVFVFSGIKTDKGDEDGVPNVLIEAAAFKVPIVTTDAGSASDLITNEETGLLVPQKNAVALADGIERGLLDESLRKKVTENAYNKVSTEFDVKKNIEEIERLIEK